MEKLNKRQLFTMFITLGAMYTFIEFAFRAIRGVLIGQDIGSGAVIQYWSLMGWASLWMIPVGGICGILLDAINETHLKKYPMALQSWIGTTIILAIELTSGLTLNRVFGLGTWTYEHLPFNLLGQICLTNAILFYFFTPYVFWLGDTLRFSMKVDKKPDSLLTYYARLVTDFKEPIWNLISRLKKSK
jgi:hypothetical protein